jgi:hypothetical protein
LGYGNLHVVSRKNSPREDREAASRAYEHWRATFPEAAQALKELGAQPSPAAYSEWRRTYPDAVRGQVRLTLYTPEVIRKMRLHDPEWRPPD